MQLELPLEFDPVWYRKMRPYIRLNDEGLRLEFEKFGKKAGVPGSPFCFRENILSVFRKINGPILEIGPGHAPDFIGDNVRYLDIVRQEELQKLYPELPDRNGGAPVITWLIQDLAEDKITAKFDLVYSAHNFEHQTNPIMHINSVARILNEGGFFLAVIPDRNYTFDYYRQNSTLVDILDASKSQVRHNLRSTLLSRTTTHNDSVRHWFGDHGESKLSDDWIIERYNKAQSESEEFSSQHVMTFDSDSFKEIFGLLSDKKLLDLNLLRVYNTPFLRNEFVAVFQKSTSGKINE